MSYTKTTWNPGAAPGISAENLNNLETQYESVVGTANASATLLHALLLQIDTRSLVATAWNADDMPTSLEVRDGIDVIGTISITYDANENITELVETAGGKQVTYTLTWDDDKFEQMTKAVVDV